MGDSGRIEYDILRASIGSSVEYQGIRCKLIEVLEEDGQIVLEACHRYTDLQAGQGGESLRHVPKVFTISVLDGSGQSHPVIQALKIKK